jgi:hypothetical protein
MFTNIRRSGVFATVGLLSLTALGMGSAHATWTLSSTTITYTANPPIAINGGNHNYNGLQLGSNVNGYTMSAFSGTPENPDGPAQQSSAGYRLERAKLYVSDETTSPAPISLTLDGNYSCDALTGGPLSPFTNAGCSANIAIYGYNMWGQNWRSGWQDWLGGSANRPFGVYSKSDQRNQTIVSGVNYGQALNPQSYMNVQLTSGVYTTTLKVATYAGSSGSRPIPGYTSYSATSQVNLSVSAPL